MSSTRSTLHEVFAALADPSRCAMVERLGRGSASVSELAEPLDMSLAAVVQHVQVLTQAGVLESEKCGRVRTCRLRPRTLAQVEVWLVRQQERFWKAGLAGMDAALGAGAKQKTRSKKPS